MGESSNFMAPCHCRKHMSAPQTATITPCKINSLEGTPGMSKSAHNIVPASKASLFVNFRIMTAC
jgi:hypothetical protein